MSLKTISRLATLMVSLLATPLAPAWALENGGKQAMDNSQIQSTIDTNNAAVAAGDIAAILATYEANSVLVAQPGTSVKGTAALGEAFKQFTAISPKIKIIRQDVIQTGDIALHTYTWTMSGKTPDGHPIEQNGFSIIVLRKQADGRWLIVIDNPFGDSLLKSG